MSTTPPTNAAASSSPQEPPAFVVSETTNEAPPDDGGEDAAFVEIPLLNGRVFRGPAGDPWPILAHVTAAQTNHASTAQLHRAGFTRTMIHAAHRRGQLHRVHQGVYRTGAVAPTARSAETAALLTGPGLVLDGLSVLKVHSLIPADLVTGVHVIGSGRHRPGVTVHRRSDAGRPQIRFGIPMTTVERALLDAAAPLAAAGALESAVGEALAARATSRTKIRELVAAHPRRPGAGLLAALVEPNVDPAVTRGWAAQRALELIRAVKLPEPRTEVELFGYPADFYWPEARLVLETDSFAWHGLIRANFNRDRRRDRVHRANGLEVVRVTADELKADPWMFVGDLAQAVARRTALVAAGLVPT